MNVKDVILTMGAMLFSIAISSEMLSAQERNRPNGPEDSQALDCSRSSAISSARFFPESGEMIVMFHRSPGKTYHYTNIPALLWNAWIAAPSKGRFFQKQISGKRFLAETDDEDRSARTALISRSGRSD